MKKLTISMFALSALFMVSCGGGKEHTAKTADSGVAEEANETEEITEPVLSVEGKDISGIFNLKEGSSLGWDARHYKDEEYVHHGALNITSGHVNVTNSQVTGGEFEFDMNSISEEGEAAPWGSLPDELKGAEFFDAEKFATATFTIKGSNAGNVTGDLTVLGVTKELTFPAEIAITDDQFNAIAEFTVNFLDFQLPGLVEGETLPEEEKMEGPNPEVRIHFEISAQREAQ